MMFRFLLVTLLCGVAFCRPQPDHHTVEDDTTTVTSTSTVGHDFHWHGFNSSNTLGDALTHHYNQHTTRQTLLTHFQTNFPEMFQRYLNADEDLTVLVPNQAVIEEALRLYQQQDLAGVRRLFRNHTLRGSHSFEELKQLTSVQNAEGDTLPVTVTQSPNGDVVIQVGDNVRINSRTAHGVELANGYFLHTE